MLESDMRQQVVAMLRSLHAFAVENGGCHPGTPDVNHRDGWIECKATEYWPAKAETPVRLDHPVTNQQKIWLRLRFRAGGPAHVLLTVDGEWLLFEGVVAAEHLGTATRAELYDLCLEHWTGTPTAEELLRWIRID
jgi:hypothetical protein